jgi:CubicO group peptidase (beta-lactamase class C family)
MRADRRGAARARPVAGVLAAAAVLLPGAAQASAAEAPRVEGVEQVLDEGADRAGAPGAAYAVVHAGGEFAGGTGSTSDGDAVTAQTPFVIGSTTKSFTALAVMQLVEEGRVELDAPVRRYVPELQLAEDAAADDITVRHVLQQSSGIPEAAGGPVLGSAREGSALEAVDELRNETLHSPPGSRWEYANANYVLAGLVVERASGLPYADYVEERIFAPLDMLRSTAGADEARELGVTAGHQLVFGVPVASGPMLRSGIQAAGYLVSTAEDLGRYLRMYLDGGVAEDGTRIVSAESLRVMTEPGPEAHLGPWGDGAEVRYAMGWFVGGPFDEPALLHAGNTPDSSAMLTLLPERGEAVATLMNLSSELPVPGNPSATDRLSRNVVEAALGEPVEPGTSSARFYVGFDLVVALLVGAAAFGLARAALAVARRRGIRSRPATGAGVALRLLAAVVLLIAPSALGGSSWARIWTWSPDLAIVLALLAALLAATAALRLLTLVRGRRTGEPGGGSAGGPALAEPQRSRV